MYLRKLKINNKKNSSLALFFMINLEGFYLGLGFENSRISGVVEENDIMVVETLVL